MAADYVARSRGAKNPNYRGVGHRKCEQCGGAYHSYDKKRRFCSQRCCVVAMPRGRARKDSNHNTIVDALEKLGVSVLDASKMGRGFPDVILGVRGINLLAEIKNPDNAYGRRGGSDMQIEFAKTWPSPIYLLYTIDDAERVAADRLHELKVMGRTTQ